MPTSFEFGAMGVTSGSSGTMDVIIGDTVVSEVITADTTNKQTTVTAPNVGGGRPVVRINTDAAVYVAVGAFPSAKNSAARFWLRANTEIVIACNPGDKAAVSTT